MITVLRDNPHAAPSLVAQMPIAAEAHTLAIDPTTKTVWTVWAQHDGDFVRGFKISP